jgi:WD40 repeat protein
LSSPVNDQRPAIRFDGREIFFFSARPGSHNQDIWVSMRATIADPWTLPINVASVNSAFNDAQCALSSDGRTLVISSDRPGGAGGVDLWVSTRGR